MGAKPISDLVDKSQEKAKQVAKEPAQQPEWPPKKPKFKKGGMVKGGRDSYGKK
jgi:hypothetical protein